MSEIITVLIIFFDRETYLGMQIFQCKKSEKCMLSFVPRISYWDNQLLHSVVKIKALLK